MKLEDLHKHCEPYEIDPKFYSNLVVLLGRVNRLEEAYCASGGKPFTVTSGFRTWKIHKEIYQLLNDRRLIQGKPEIPVPLHSRHLTGEAVDIWDPERKLQAFLTANIHLLEQAELWCEDFKSTSDWVHFQTVAPKSGKRFFQP